MVRPLRTEPVLSRSAAVTCVVWVATRFADVGASVTVATGGGVTVMVAVPVRPSLVAVITVVPTPTVVTSPVLAPTKAMAVFAELQTTVRPVSTLAILSRSIAAS
jgi:hypothetical protein